MRVRLRSNDLEALIAMTQDRPSVAEALPKMTMPCLLFVGEADPRLARVRQCAAALGNATLFTLPGKDHVGAFAASALVLPHMQAFLAKVNAT